MGYKLDRCLKQSVFPLLLVFYYFFQSVIEPFMITTFFSEKGEDCTNAWDDGTTFTLKLLLTRTPMPVKSSDFKVLAQLDDLSYSNPSKMTGDLLLDVNYTLKLSDAIKRNETVLYLQVAGSETQCRFSEYQTADGHHCYTVRATQPIIQWIQKKVDLSHNLLTEKAVEIPEGPMPFEPVVFTNMSFDIVFDNEVVNPKLVYTHNGDYLLFAEAIHKYLPPASYDDFWDLETHRTYLDFENNETVDLNIRVYLRRKWLWNKKLEYDRGQDEGDYMHKQWEDMKRAMADTPPLLLWTTIFVTIAHVFLNLMAFREDISWWNSRDTMTGISLQAVVIDAFSKFVIFLFLMDEDTSTVVRVMHGIGVILELWKISKLVEPIMDFPWFKIKESYRSSTMDADWEGSRYLGYVMLPLLIGYAIYSVIYKKFKGLYSFVLRVAVGAVYAFGFMAMIPQIYINYKLKTVAGMSGPVLAYKFVNTFIDDLFAFVMTMPTIHRIACFRDDIVFFVWIYQRHVYPTDLNRVNEFGEAFDEEGRVKIVIGDDPEVEEKKREAAAKGITEESEQPELEEVTAIGRPIEENEEEVRHRKNEQESEEEAVPVDDTKEKTE